MRVPWPFRQWLCRWAEHWKSTHLPIYVINEWSSPHVFMSRWDVIRPNKWLNIRIHEQGLDDPDPVFHDHPWCNLSIILSEGYVEAIYGDLPVPFTEVRSRSEGDIIFRKATLAHRIVLHKYWDGEQAATFSLRSLSLFITGPTERVWGVWTPKGWTPHHEHTPGGGPLLRTVPMSKAEQEKFLNPGA